MMQVLMTPASSHFGRYILLAAQIIITLSLFSILIFIFDWNKVWQTLAIARLDYLFGALFCLVAILLVGALNIWILLYGVAAISYGMTLRVYLESWCTFLLLPGAVGDAVQLFFFREAGIPYRDSGAVYITDKIVTLGVAVLVSVAGGLIYFRPFLRPWILLGTAALLGLIFVAAYKLGQEATNVWILRALSLAGAPILFYKHHASRVRINVIGTVTKLVLTGLSHWLTFQAIGADVSYGVVLTVAVLAGLVAYVPVAFNGLGTVEFAAVTLYGVSNVLAYQVLATYVILRTSNILLAVVALVVSRLLTSNLFGFLIQRRDDF